MTLFTTSASDNVVHLSKESLVHLRTSRQVMMSCMIGNALEWFDFVIYGYFVVIFGQLFFPNANHLTQILASWGIFWSGFLARPLGSIVFGHIGDKTSRKYALTLSIFMMAIPTTLMGMLPTYQQVGMLAPILLIFLRAVQGFAIGGEYTGSMVFLVEHAPMGKRGVWGSWASFSAVLGVIIGSSLVGVLHHSLAQDSMQIWGWRIPFLLSALGSIVGIYIRIHLSDPSVYLEVKARKTKESIPFKDLMLNHKSKIGMIIMLDFLTAVGFFIIAIFLATYFRSYLDYSERTALAIHTLNMLVLALAILVGGWLSDRVGRNIVMGLSCVGIMIFSYPLFQLIQIGGHFAIIFVQASLAIMFGLFFGVIPTALAEIMPTNVRFSGLSIGHNLCMAIIGGGTPFLATHLIHNTNDLSSPAYLLIFSGAVSFCSLWFIKDRYRMALD
ncbi:MAG: MFS transporter [Gammaproteobacteria bacterium]|nr:MFS transporter [Gammaproteobacteria bacterium]